MFSLRRSALRILSSTPSSFVSQPRTITTLTSQSLLRSKSASSSIIYQRRWATGEAGAKAEEVPVSQIQPTPQEEVENAVHEDAAAGAMSEGAPAEDVSADTQGNASNDGASVGGAPTMPPSEDVSSKRGAAAFNSPPADDISRAERITQPKPTVYIGNLFFDVTEEDLTKELARFGKVEQVRLMRDSRGLSKGFGYVDFGSTEEAAAAVEALHQQLYEGRRIVVQYAAYTTAETRARRGPAGGRDNTRPRGPVNPPSKTLFIGNMSFEMNDRDLNNLFRGIRNVVDVRVAIDRRTGQPRGFAHADFIDIKSAMEAMKVLQDKETYGRKLRLDYSFGASNSPKNQSPPSAGFGGESEQL